MHQTVLIEDDLSRKFDLTQEVAWARRPDDDAKAFTLFRREP